MNEKQFKNSFFSMRKNHHSANFDLAGYWTYPAFVRNKGDIYWLSLILPVVTLPEKKKTALFRPKSSLLYKPDSMTVVKYDNFRLGHDPFPSIKWDTPVDFYPHKTIGDFKVSQLRKEEEGLLKACVAETENYKNKKQLSEKFISKWLELTPPSIVRFLQPLAPEFTSFINE